MRSTWVAAASLLCALGGASAGSEHGVVGLDLGAESSVVAIARRGGIDVIANEQAHRQTPSAVGFGGRARLFGDAALAKLGSNGANTVASPIALVAALADRPLAVRVEHAPVAAGGGAGVGGRGLARAELSPLQLLGAQAAHLLRLAAEDHGCARLECCVAVPAGFTARQRRLLAAAAELGGNGECIRLIPADAAALLALALARAPAAGAATGGEPAAAPAETTVALVDAGHAGLRVCVARLREGGVDILARRSATFVGGRAVTHALGKSVAARWRAEHGVDALADRRTAARLASAAAAAKRALSAAGCEAAQLKVEQLAPHLDGSAAVCAADVEAAAAGALGALEALCAAALSDARLGAVDSAELVGGFARMPSIAVTAGRALGGAAVRHSLNDAEAVARGAALAGAAASPSFRVRDLRLTDRLGGAGVRVFWLGAPCSAPARGRVAEEAGEAGEATAFEVGAQLPGTASVQLPAGAAAELLARGRLQLLICRADARGVSLPGASGVLTHAGVAALTEAADEAAMAAAAKPGGACGLGAGALEAEEIRVDVRLPEGWPLAERARAAAAVAEGGTAGRSASVRAQLAADLCGDVRLVEAALSWEEEEAEAEAGAQPEASAPDGPAGAGREAGEGGAPLGGTAEAAAAEHGGGGAGQAAAGAPVSAPPPPSQPRLVQRRVPLALSAPSSSADVPSAELAAARALEAAMARADAAEAQAQAAHNALEGAVLSAAAELRQAEDEEEEERARAVAGGGDAPAAAPAARARERLREWLAAAEAWLEEAANAQRQGGAAGGGEAHALACAERMEALRELLAAALLPSGAAAAGGELAPASAPQQAGDAHSDSSS